MSQEREAHFQGYAKIRYEDLYDMFNNLFIEEADMGPREQEAERTREHIQSYISEHAYDLVQHACVAINNAQMQQGGVTLHPNAMMRAIPDMTE